MKKKQLSMYLPEILYKLLEEEANREYRNVTQQLIEILKERYRDIINTEDFL